MGLSCSLHRPSHQVIIDVAGPAASPSRSDFHFDSVSLPVSVGAQLDSVIFSSVSWAMAGKSASSYLHWRSRQLHLGQGRTSWSGEVPASRQASRGYLMEVEPRNPKQDLATKKVVDRKFSSHVRDMDPGSFRYARIRRRFSGVVRRTTHSSCGRKIITAHGSRFEQFFGDEAKREEE